MLDPQGVTTPEWPQVAVPRETDRVHLAVEGRPAG
jgi:hypothetical protein